MVTLIYLLLPLNLFYSGILYLQPSHTTIFNYLFNLSYGFYYLVVVVLCIKQAKSDNSSRSLYLALGTGALTYFLAQITWLYYNLAGSTSIPYPGPADFFWILYYLLTALGMYGVAHKIGISFEWSRFVGVILTFGINLLLLYTFMSQNITPDPSSLVNILNWSYPVFDALLLTMSLTMIRSQLGHLQPQLLYFVGSFVFLTFGDAIFAYQNNLETYWNGNLVDALYVISGALFVLGVHALPAIIRSTATSSITAGSNNARSISRETP